MNRRVASHAERAISVRATTAGFTYVGLLIAIALAGTGLAAAGTIWSTVSLREREAQLLFAGDQYRRALESYADRTPPGSRRFPASLDELLDDRRWPETRRHLRRHYVDPLTGAHDWVLLRDPQGRVVGLHSRSATTPITRTRFAPEYESFSSATRHSDWIFQVRDAQRAAPVAAGQSATGGPVGGPREGL